jgi:hypothetical protein
MLRSHKPTRIGDILIERGIISRPQLLQALDFQQARQLMVPETAGKEAGNELGEILIELGFITREQLQQNLARQSRLRKTTLVVSFVAPLFTMACGGGGSGGGTAPTNKPIQSTASSSVVVAQSSSQVSSTPPQSPVSSSASSLSSNAQTPALSSAQSSMESSVSSQSLSSAQQLSSSSSSSSAVNGPVVLYWAAPTRRLNGDHLDITELGGYEVRYKLRDQDKFEYITIPDAFTDSYYFDHLDGDYEFQIAAYDKEGLYSNFVVIEPVD